MINNVQPTEFVLPNPRMSAAASHYHNQNKTLNQISEKFKPIQCEWSGIIIE